MIPRINNKFILSVIIFLFVSKIIFSQTAPKVYINEFLSSNLTTFPDMVDFGDFSDWIELYNDENSSVNISGYYLSDDFTIPMQWQIPNNTIIPAKGFYLFWADGFNDTPGHSYIRNWWPNNIQFTTKWNHTNFRLNKDNDKIGLFDNAGNIIDTISFTAQATDVSFGRQPNGTNNWVYFGEPTPLKSNLSVGINTTEQSADVNFSVEGGFYSTSVNLVLSSSNGNGIIRYTTDGSFPTSSSNQYQSPININSNKIIRARLFENLKIPGKTITNSYFISEVQNLPVVSMVTEPSFLMSREIGIYRNTYKEREIPASLEYFPKNSSRAFSLDAGVRIGGENIFRFAEKPLNIYAHSNYGYSHINYKIFDDQPFLEYKRLYLRNSGDDWPFTMFRDGLLVNIIKDRVLNSVQAFKPSVLYLNNQYWGIYNLREKIDEQYFFLHYNTDPLDLDHLEYDGKIISGDSTDFNSLLAFVNQNNLSDSANYSYVKNKVDFTNLMDFVIVQDYLANSSWSHNREEWRDKKNDNLWRWILVDMDRGFNSSRISSNQLDDIFTNFELFKKLCDNVNFKNQFIQRYAQHLNHTFNTGRVSNIIDSLKSLIEPEMPRHIEKWGTYIDSLTIDFWGQTAGISSLSFWNSEVQKLRNFGLQREAYAVQHLSNRFNLSGRSNLKITTNIQNQGKIYINDYQQNYDIVNLFFKDIPLKITASPPPGYVLKNWKESVLSNSINIIPAGSQWKYWDLGNSPNVSWKTNSFDDSPWKSGNAQFGYGDGDENTIISFGPDSQNKYITSYYRHTFQIDDPANVSSIKIKLLRDDGAVIYLNGTEILRSNMPSGVIQNSTKAIIAVGDLEESTFFEFNFDNSLLLTGSNILAVEIHQSDINSSDISFDLSLEATLSQQTINETVISNNESINYILKGDTELMVEYEQVGLGSIPATINGALTLSKSSSPYYVEENITINESGILSVDPGVIIYFAPNKGIHSFGQILMNGTFQDPIVLTSYYPSDKWGAISFENSNKNSSIKYVNISNSTNGKDEVNFFASISSLNSSVSISNVKFDNVTLPVSSQFSNMSIDSCYFDNVTLIGDYINCTGGNISISNSTLNGNNIADMDGIDLGLMSGTTTIFNNKIINFTGSNSDGIDLGEASAGVSIHNNLIMNCADKGVSIGQGSNANLERNTIVNCSLGVGIKDSLSFANIINCTFYKNNVGIACFVKHVNGGGGSANIINSIISNSAQSAIVADNLSTIVINYSISDTDILPGLTNIFGSPLMINPDGENFHIRVNSPCRDTGDPQSKIDYDGSRADIGANVFSGISPSDLVINEINYNSSTSFDSGDWIEIYNNSDKSLDLSNWVFMSENLSPSFALNSGTILQPGSYMALCRDLTLFKSMYPDVTNVLGDLKSGLSGSGESIFMYDNLGHLLDSLTYDDKAPWPTAADGAGSSLELTNPTFDNGISLNWKASISHGTPGKINSTFVVGIDKDNNKDIIPEEFALFQNYPNPFNPSTSINFNIPELSKVSISIYDVLGRNISILTNREYSPGKHSLIWDASLLSSGIYFIKMSAESHIGNKLFNAVIKSIVVK